MITSTIGKKFLKAYNEEYKTDYDAKQFFIEKFYPLFFDHNKYMMTAGNSPLENPKISWEKMILGNMPFETEERRGERFNNLINKISSSEADASIAIGYPSLDENATTSGQVTNLKIPIDKDDIYSSWIGAALSIGVQGGISIILDQSDILLSLYKGWEMYRKVLNTTSNLKGNQINTWNGQWLAHFYNKKEYDDNNPMANFNPFEENKGLMSISTQSWTIIMIRLSQQFTNPHMMGYVYNIGQMNTTIGFIPFVLSQIKRPIELYKKFFNIDSGKKAEALWGTAYGLRKACQSGVVGIKALEPKGMSDYILKGKLPKLGNNENDKLNFNVYIIWILAMLNNEELWNIAHEFAKELQNYSSGNNNAKKDKSNKVNAVITSTNKTTFIKALTEIVADVDNKAQIENIASVVNRMPTENVPYFLTLMRFHYAAINNQK